MNIEKRYFGSYDGRAVDLYSMTLDSGMSVDVITLGGAIVKLVAPNKAGKLDDVVLGFDSISSYLESDGYQGAIVGRVANRIARAEFTLDGEKYKLYPNDGENSLHGGKVGFSHRIWDAESYLEDDGCVLELRYVSPDGEEGYPGTLQVNVTYKLKNDNSISITYRAVSDKKTVINLSNHAYFNLGGYNSGKIFDHVMWIDADSYIPTDEFLIPTGEILPVKDTPFDFTVAKSIGRDFDLSFKPMALARGYDHCLNFRQADDPLSQPRIRVFDPRSEREMVVYTDAPCVQFYSANFMTNPDYPFKGGYPQQAQNAFCLETQKMPDSPNRENFTSVTLDAGEVYSTKTVYKFLVD